MILVTGGAGFIGSHLCRRLVLEGYDVVSLDDYSTGSYQNHVPDVTYREGRTADIAKLVYELSDVIFHLGEYARVESSFRDLETVRASNMLGSAAVFAYWAMCDAKLVYAGSSTRFGDVESPYSEIKAHNADYVLHAVAEGQRGAVTYFYNVYGPGERSNDSGTLIEKFRQKHLAGEPLPVVYPGTQRRHFTHVDDIVDGLMLAMEHDGEFQIGAAEDYSVLEVAEMFGGPIKPLPAREGNRMDSTIDRSAIHALGWRQKHKLADYIAQIIGAKAAA